MECDPSTQTFETNLSTRLGRRALYTSKISAPAFLTSTGIPGSRLHDVFEETYKASIVLNSRCPEATPSTATKRTEADLSDLPIPRDKVECTVSSVFRKEKNTDETNQIRWAPVCWIRRPRIR
jgi:hypothetical protein